MTIVTYSIQELFKGNNCKQLYSRFQLQQDKVCLYSPAKVTEYTCTAYYSTLEQTLIQVTPLNSDGK